jgi:hypothetical protein
VGRWQNYFAVDNRNGLDDLTRFSEAIDEALYGSVARHDQRIDRARYLLLGALGHGASTRSGALLPLTR